MVTNTILRKRNMDKKSKKSEVGHPMLHGHLGKDSQNWLSGKMANPLVKKKSSISKTLKKLK